MKRWLSLLLPLALILIAVAHASTPAGYWTPSQTSRTLMASGTATMWFTAPPGANRVNLDWSGRRVVSKAACRGMGPARQGRFAAFFCAVTWSYRQDSSHVVFDENAYVRVWSSSQACASTRALADCPPPLVGAPLPGDPRCGTRSADCMAKVASGKIFEALREGHFLPIVNGGCLAATAFVYKCTWSPPGRSDWPTGATVRWVQGKTAWRVTVALTGP